MDDPWDLKTTTRCRGNVKSCKCSKNSWNEGRVLQSIRLQLEYNCNAGIIDICEFNHRAAGSGWGCQWQDGMQCHQARSSIDMVAASAAPFVFAAANLLIPTIQFSLIPFNLESLERMKKLFLLFTTIDEYATKAFIGVSKIIFVVCGWFTF